MSLPRALAALLAALLLSVAALAGPRTAAGPYRLSIVTVPTTVALGRAQLLVTVTDSAGRPAEGLTVTALTGMPGMFMGEREETGRPEAGQPGVWRVAAQFPMAGAYLSTIRLNGPRGAATAKVELRTGQDTAESGGKGFPVGGVALVAFLLAAAGFTLHRMRRTGQILRPGALLNAQTLGGLALVGVLLIGAIWAVSHGRRNGAMTPLDAQAADMTNMPPPSGATPVELAPVTRGEVRSVVRYPGTAAGFTEQEVAARVGGVLQEVRVYPGDRVVAGQLLARIDTRLSAPQTAERAAMAAAAREGVGVAQAEADQAQEEVHQAHAELAGKVGALEEARAILTAAQQERSVGDATLAAAHSQVAGAQADLQSAQADQTYWQKQIGRSRTLHDAGAISGEELQRDTAQAAAADAKVEQTRAKVAEAGASVSAALSARQRADAQIAAATARVDMARSELDAHNARVRVAAAAVAVARRKTLQARSGARQAGAALEGARVTQAFSEVRAPSEGVVLQRVASPGSLVAPGQLVLRVAQIRPIRLQATVAEADLVSIRPGARVVVQPPGDGPSLSLRVSSVSPALDPVARTGTVEALASNRDGRLLPGQYVAFEIETGAASGLRVPTRAIQYGTDSKPFVWVAEPAGPGQLAARRVPVVPGAAGRYMVAVTSGLSEGQKVVVAGGAFLKDGDALTPTEPQESGTLRIAVTDQGFEPATIPVRVGVPTKIAFTRTSDATCATEVLFPDYGIDQKLPLNVPVEVTFTPKKAGAIRFACGMDMVKGKAVAR